MLIICPDVMIFMGFEPFLTLEPENVWKLPWHSVATAGMRGILKPPTRFELDEPIMISHVPMNIVISP